MIKMHCFSWYSGSVHCHLTQIWNYSQRNTVDLGDSEWPNWRRRMTKSEEEGLLTIVTTFVSEIYFSMWFLESSCVDDSEYVPNLPAAMNIFFTTSVQSENLTFLGVRSTNPLPAASGLVKLTRRHHTRSERNGVKRTPARLVKLSWNLNLNQVNILAVLLQVCKNWPAVSYHYKQNSFWRS